MMADSETQKPLSWLPSSGTRWILLVLVLLAAVLRLASLDEKSLWLDELVQLILAQGSVATLPARLLDQAGVPLDYLLSRVLQSAGHQEFWLRSGAAFFSILTIPVFYQWGRRLLGLPSALAATVLLAVAPLAVHFAQEVRPYAALAFWAVVASFLLLGALQRGGGRWWLAYGLAATIALHTHLFFLAVLAAHGTWLLLLALGGLLFSSRPTAEPWAWRWSRQRGLYALVTFCALAAVTLFSPGIPGYLSGVITRFLGITIGSQVAIPGPIDPQPGGLTEIRWALLREAANQLGPGHAEPASLAFLLLAAVGMVAGLRRRPAGTLSLLLVVLPGTLLVLALLASREARFHPRHLIFAQPAYLLLVGVGAAALGQAAGQLVQGHRLSAPARWGVAALVTLFLVLQARVGLTTYYNIANEDWRGVSGFLQSVAEPGDQVVTARALGNYVAFYWPQVEALRQRADRPEDLQLLEGDRLWLLDTPYDNVLKSAAGQAWLADSRAVALPFPPLHVLYFVNRGGDPLADVESWVVTWRPNDPAWRQRLADAYKARAAQQLAAGEVEEARGSLDKLTAYDTGSFRRPPELQDIGQLYVQAEDWMGAIPWLERLVALRPGNAEARRALGLSYLRLGRPEDAKDQLHAALRSDSGDYQTNLLLGEALAALDDAEGALEVYQAARTIDPNQVMPYRRMGEIYLRQGEARAAVAIYRQALTILADQPEILRDLAVALEASGDGAGARATWERYLEVAPAGPFAEEAAARIEALAGQ